MPFDEIVGLIIFKVILNFIGGVIRWTWGILWRTLLGKPKYSFKEYLYGPKKSKDHWDKHHMFNNCFIAIVFIALVGFGIALL